MALDSISFTVRITNYNWILSNLRKYGPEEDSKTLQARAKNEEEQCFRQAASVVEYETAIRDVVAALSHQNRTEAYQEEASQAKEHFDQQVGPYPAAYHSQGIFSTIYMARWPEDNSLIAIKLSRPASMAPPHNTYREARILRLSASQHVIKLLDAHAVHDDGHYALLFPFYNYNFSELIARSSLSPHQTRSILKDLFSALSHIHSLGIMHRDVKPSNILLNYPLGPAVLADFGIAWKAADPDSELADEKITDIGTTSYRPPELLFGDKSYGLALDMWAAGCVVAEALRGGEKPLFHAGDLGSELALIKSIFETLGTPNEQTWPEASDSLPDWGKFEFTKYPRKPWEEILPKSDPKGLDLVDTLVRYQSTERLTALEALKHPYFDKP